MLILRPSLRTLRITVWSAIGALLLAPLAAMQLTDEVAWTVSDFAAAAVMLGVVGLSFEVISRSPLRPMAKCVLLTMVLVLVALIWAHGAVGL